MNKNKVLSATLSTALLAGVSAGALAAENPFDINPMKAGYDVVSKGDAEGKCGEGKCGEGKCGEKKGDAEGKCGEGKCGEKKGDAEGKCGEGKCGAK